MRETGWRRTIDDCGAEDDAGDISPIGPALAEFRKIHLRLCGRPNNCREMEKRRERR